MPGYSGSTYNDQIERVYRRLKGSQRDSVVTLFAPALITDTSLTVTGLGSTGCHAGGIIAIGTEVVLIEAANINVPSLSAVLTVQRGYQGSTAAAYSAGQVCYVDPRFTRWDIAVALNDALGYLSSNTYGMFQVITNTVIFNPVLRGYDLSAWPADILKVVGLRFDVPDASHYFPRIRSFELVRGISSPKIPSGNALFLNEQAWPGLAISVSLACPFTQMVNLTDDMVTNGGLDSGAIDIPAICAEIDITIGQEIKRGDLGSQTDPQKLQNVPPGTTTNAVMALKMLRDEAVAREANRLALKWPEYLPEW